MLEKIGALNSEKQVALQAVFESFWVDMPWEQSVRSSYKKTCDSLDLIKHGMSELLPREFANDDVLFFFSLKPSDKF